MSDNHRAPTPEELEQPAMMARELRWWAENVKNRSHACTLSGWERGLIKLLEAAALVLESGIPCPACGEEAVGRMTCGDEKWLQCMKCATRFAPVTVDDGA